MVTVAETEALRRHVEGQQAAHIAAAGKLALAGEARKLNSTEFLSLRGYLNDLRDDTALLSSFPQIRVREPGPYDPGSPHSFYADVAAKAMQRFGVVERSPVAGFEERLRRHNQVEAEARASTDAKAWDTLRGALGERGEIRAVTSTLGSGGEFDVPAWLIDRFAPSVAAGRVLADLVGSLPLPGGVSSIHVPRVVAGASNATQLDAGPVAGGDPTTADASSTVITIAGKVDVSQQLFDQSPAGFDTYASIELNSTYNEELEEQMMFGSGATGQLLGVTNVAGINTVAGGTGTTVTALWPLLGQAAAAVANTRLMPPEAWLLAGRRWFWMASQVDTSNHPIVSPGSGDFHAAHEAPAAGGAFPFGDVLGLPAYMTGAIPGGGAVDQMICLRPADMLLWESRPRVTAAASPLSGTLGIRLTLHRYVAFIPHRYPSGIGVVSAIPQPANY